MFNERLIAYKNTGDKTILKNSVLKIGEKYGIACNHIEPNETQMVVTTGEYTLPKDTETEFEQCISVSWDSENNKVVPYDDGKGRLGSTTRDFLRRVKVDINA